MSASPSGPQEPEKVIITSKSWFTSLQQCVIHLVPMSASVIIMTVNIRRTYLSADLMSPVRSETINLLFLQVAAKAHEIMIVASLSLVVLQFVRHELLFGDGLPLGFIGSGITFNNFEFFFKKEFRGAMKYISLPGNKLRKVAFVSLIMIAGFVAALAGPASAVLLVPKDQDWEAGGTQFFLNGTESELWPSDLTGELSELRQFCSPDNSTSVGICPAAGFRSLWTHWGTMNSTDFRTQNVRSYAKEVSGSSFYWPVSSPWSLIPPLYSLGDSQQGTSLIQPHAATVVVLQELAEDWWKALTAVKKLSSNQVDDRVVSAKFKNAITVVHCGEPQKLQASNRTVRFPSIDGRFNFADSLPVDVDSLNGTRTDHIRFQWIHLPERFGATSIGGLFETAWEGESQSDASRAVIGCTVQAGWVPATVFTDKYTFWTGWYPWNIQFGDRTPAWNGASKSSTNGRIAFGDEWLRLLTPKAPPTAFYTESWRPSTIESIFLNAGLADYAQFRSWLSNSNSTRAKVSLLEAIVCSVVLDGLSRTGSYRAFDTSGSSSEWSIANYNLLPNFESRVLKNEQALQTPALDPDQFTTIQAEMKISGFSFQTSLASFLAMSVLLTHILLATAHIGYILYKRQSSSSWSSVAGLIALAQNSQPAFGSLANTGGGIECSQTYGQVAKIRAKNTPGIPNHKHVELLFEEHFSSEDMAVGHEPSSFRYRCLRHPATWPNRKIQVVSGDNAEIQGLSSSTERLVPETAIEAGEAMWPVYAGQPYG
ncbi:hypothetical protein P175DRAFT_0440547 [Aspergillus ochraceoroseus IBT 24754]|uniref:Uncharacterized protein n=3 Tax=Aspergillus subgen. Nidulantes TaxID=2720870 RepID=A0A0F8VN07_9EURO|nr:uncharacterized protein P175DRAFT_0440547 [Aspergillus ochraceoroseus IBT 24754]KKK20324.1 hypothetical protein AOCH_002253 [Aspergillus ochraceoroseus]KKK24511.1 hypothetical protein ARAM_002355 [Aspergillus rambellii]PTU19099.1 hypothetical protein P175DRAFT_0440547 [Aspergillus ochraceoroseus IBT 24754]